MGQPSGGVCVCTEEHHALEEAHVAARADGDGAISAIDRFRDLEEGIQRTFARESKSFLYEAYVCF